MRKDYQRMQEDLLPGKETREWIWEAIEEKSAKRKKKSSQKRIAKWVCGIAAAVFVCIFFIPQTGLAEGMKSLFHNFLFVDMDDSQDVMHNVYEDQDGHVKMQIEEMVSDGACMYFNICYEALDEIGKEWLSDYDFTIKQYGEGIRFANLDNNYVGGNAGFAERKELATDTKRYFTLYNRCQGQFQYDNIKRTLFYPMSYSQGIGVITLKRNLDISAYQLVGEGSPSLYYTPKYLLASKLSFGIYGDSKGAYRETLDEEGNLSVIADQGYIDECEKRRDALAYGDIEVIFHMEDGTKIPIYSHDGGPIWEDWPEKVNTDEMCIAASYYFECDFESEVWPEDPSKRLENINLMLNPEDMVGVELGGVYYKLEPCGGSENIGYPNLYYD